jgi:cell division protein FtsB
MSVMGLLELFNKWIVENGSTVLQERHIALFRDHLVAADKNTLALESENSELKSENSELKANNETLKGILQKQEKINGHSNLLEDAGGRILY